MCLQPTMALAILICVPLALPAQDQKALEKLRAEKLGREVFKKNGWITDYDKARAEAKKSGKLLFTYFTRSHTACPPSDALESGAFSDPAFADFARQVVLFVHNTSRVADEPYPKLMQEKGFTAFPSLCFMDAEGNVLMKQTARTVAGFATTLGPLEDERQQRQQLEAKARAGDPAAAKQLFLADLANLDAEQLKAGMKQHKLSKEERPQVDQALTDLDFKAILAKPGERIEKLHQHVAALAKAGRRPSRLQADAFWTHTLQHAAAGKDAALAEQAFTELEGLSAADKTMQSRLVALRRLRDQARDNIALPLLVGTVSVVSGRLLTISITENPTKAEVKPGYSFAIYEASTYKGEARVSEVSENLVFCTVGKVTDGTTIKVGDQATTQKRP